MSGPGLPGQVVLDTSVNSVRLSNPVMTAAGTSGHGRRARGVL